MKAKHLVLPGLFALSSFGNAAAQEPIRREVDVTRAYEPSVQNALKINIMPDMTDTVQLRPTEFQYQITPRPMEHGFEAAPLAAARIEVLDRLVPQPFYLKLGAGAPLRSVGELRYSHSSGRTDFGAFASHAGRYDKIENDMQVEESAFGTDNRAGAYLNFRPDDGFSIDAEAGYRFRNVTRYGYFGQASEMPYYDLSDEALKQFFHNPYARVSMGSDFQELKHFGARVGGGIDHVADRYRYDQTRWEVDAALGLRLSGGGLLTFSAQAGQDNGRNNLKGYNNRIGSMEAAYAHEHDGLRLRLGAGVGFWQTTFHEGGEPVERSVLLPQLTFEKTLFEGRLVPYWELRSEIIDNSFGELLKHNPYTFSGTRAPNTIAYRARIGAKGALGTFKYKMFGGFDRLLDNFYWANTQEYSAFGNAFTTLTDDRLHVFRAGVEMQANVLDMLTLHGALNAAHYDSKNFDHPGGLPKLTLRAGMGYNYRNRFYINVEAEYLDRRTMYEIRNRQVFANELPSQIDLRAAVEYWAGPRLGFFVQVNNLLNEDIYEFNRYRELGINGLAGVKISF